MLRTGLLSLLVIGIVLMVLSEKLDASAIKPGKSMKFNAIRGMFEKYVDKFIRRPIKYTRRNEFCINEYQLLDIK